MMRQEYTGGFVVLVGTLQFLKQRVVLDIILTMETSVRQLSLI